jgi:hypothetical protein
MCCKRQRKNEVIFENFYATLGFILKMRFSLSTKLLVFICSILVLTILPLFYIAETALSRFGSYSVLVNKNQITNISRQYLTRVADEIAQKHN